MGRVGIIGVGNPLRRDDGIGLELLDFLKKQKTMFSRNVEFVDAGTSGMKLLHLLARFDTVLIVDAVDFKGNAGETRLFTLAEIQKKKPLMYTSTHEPDIIDALALSKQLNELPCRLYVFGVQPYDVSFGIGSSEQLKEHRIQIQKTLIKEVQKIITAG